MIASFTLEVLAKGTYKAPVTKDIASSDASGSQIIVIASQETSHLSAVKLAFDAFATFEPFVAFAAYKSKATKTSTAVGVIVDVIKATKTFTAVEAIVEVMLATKTFTAVVVIVVVIRTTRTIVVTRTIAARNSLTETLASLTLQSFT